MKEILFFFLFAVAAEAQAAEDRPQTSETFSNFAEMGVEGRLRFYWKFDETHITFEVHGNTSGWVGVGFSPNGGMAGADMYVAWVKDGVARITDRHGLDRNGFPPKDNEQNMELLSGRECKGWTMIKFRRQIPSCEESADWTLTTDTVRVIWALGASDPEGNDITNVDYHGNTDRGTRSLLILEASSGSSSIPEEEIESFHFLNDIVSVPPIDTYYSCTLAKLPDFPSKRHLIRVEPVIEEANSAYVHHMLVYQCSFDRPQNLSVVGRSHECLTANMPEDFEQCEVIMLAWAIGGQAFVFPDHAGLPFGEDDSPSHILLQTHYDNPGLHKGIVDSSGLRFVFTSQLRQNDAGILEVGVPPINILQLIPPNMTSFHSSGECPSACLDRAMEHENTTEIRLFAVLLHSHLLARKMNLKHIASDRFRELPPIAQDKSFDFNYQEYRHFQKEVVFRQGESMQMICEYDSRGRQGVTPAGRPATEEMCLAYVMYYPRVPTTTCQTFPHPSFFYEAAFGITNLTYPQGTVFNYTLDQVTAGAPEKFRGRTLRSIVNEFDWNELSASRFNEMQKQAVRGYDCRARVDLQPAPPSLGGAPRITQPYQAPRVTCVEPTSGKPTKRNVDDCSTFATPDGGSMKLGRNYAYVLCAAVLFIVLLF